MTITADVRTERAALTEALTMVGLPHRPRAVSGPPGISRLLLRPRVAPLSLFEYWTHHDDLLGGNGVVHAAPATLTEVIPLLLRYQHKKLPAGIRVTLTAAEADSSCSVGPRSGPEVIVAGPCADLVRWLSGRRAQSEITLTGQDTRLQAVRAFGGQV